MDALDFGCGIAHSRSNFELAPPASADRGDGQFLEIELITDADIEWVRAYGSQAAANEEILTLVNNVDGIYREQLGLTVKVIHQEAWENENSYTDREYPYDNSDYQFLLFYTGLYYEDRTDLPEFDLVHLFSRKNFGGVRGVAYVGGVCDWMGRYGLSTFSSSPATTSLILAHEIGHNLGSEHDTCSGEQRWIMCPTSSDSDKFSPESVQQIQEEILQSSCLSPIEVIKPNAPARLRIRKD